MSHEVTWEWEYWQEVSRRSGALVLALFGRETRVLEDNGINSMVSWRFPAPIPCSGGDQIAARFVYRREVGNEKQIDRLE